MIMILPSESPPARRPELDWRSRRCIHDITFDGVSAQRPGYQLHFLRTKMTIYTRKEKSGITAGAIAALVIVAWLAVIGLALLSGG
jgi:hypothetical protein